MQEEKCVRSLFSVASNSNWIMAGHADGRLRYWDLARPAESYVVSGASASGRSIYAGGAVPASLALASADTTVLTVETPLPSNARGGGEARGGPVSATQAAAVPTAHRDAVLCMAALAAPAPMLLTASREGVVKVWL